MINKTTYSRGPRRDWKRNCPSHNAMVPPTTLSLSNRPWRFVTISWERWKYPIHRASNNANSEHLSLHYYFLTPPSFFCKMAKKTDKKKGRSAINEVVTREYTINVHKRIHGMWVVSLVILKKNSGFNNTMNLLRVPLTIDSLGKFLLFLLNPSILFKNLMAFFSRFFFFLASLGSVVSICRNLAILIPGGLLLTYGE